MVVLLFSLAFMPVQGTYITEHQYNWELAKLIVDVIFIVDIILTFYTGYYDRRKRRVILQKSHIAIHYIGGLFIFDVLSSFNSHFIDWYINASHMQYFFRVCNLCKIARFRTLFRYIQNFQDKYQLNPYQVRIVKLCYAGCASALWAACILFFIAYYSKENFLYGTEDTTGTVKTGIGGFVICLKRVIKLILLVGCGQQSIRSSFVLTYEICLVFVGAAINIYILSQILQIVNKYNSCRNKYLQLTQSLQEYAECMKLPVYLKQKIIEYFDFKFQKLYFKESEIMGTISTQLQQAIVLHTCKHLLESVEIFTNIPPVLLSDIVTSMKSSIFLPGDVIVQAGMEGDSMYFIHTGTVAIYTNFGKEVCHLGEGSHFGEIALVMEDKRVASVIAVDPCELYTLSRKDFHKAIEPYPDLYTRIKKLAHVRLASTMKEVRQEETSTASTLNSDNVSNNT